MFKAPATVSLQLVLAGQAASTGTSGLRGSPGTAVLGLLSSPAGGKCDQLLCQHLLEQKLLGSVQCQETSPGVLAVGTSSCRGT